MPRLSSPRSSKPYFARLKSTLATSVTIATISFTVMPPDILSASLTILPSVMLPIVSVRSSFTVAFSNTIVLSKNPAIVFIICLKVIVFTLVNASEPILPSIIMPTVRSPNDSRPTSLRVNSFFMNPVTMDTSSSASTASITSLSDLTKLPSIIEPIVRSRSLFIVSLSNVRVLLKALNALSMI